MGENSVYSICGRYISLAEEEGRLAIQSDWLADRVCESADLSEMSREDLERRYVKACNLVCLYQRGYRSVVAGHGYYVKPEVTSRRQYLEKMVSNAEDAELAKSLTKVGLQNILKASKGNADHQMAFDDDGNYYTEPTVDELLEMLVKDA